MRRTKPLRRRTPLSPAKKKSDEDFNAGDTIHLAGVTYQLRWVKCGKPGCHRLHGPYWYAFTKVGGRVHCQYVGKKLRPDVLEHGHA